MQILGAYAALTHQVDGTFASLYERDPAILLTHYAKKILATEIGHAWTWSSWHAAQAHRAAHRRRYPHTADPVRGTMSDTQA